jgi:hypothetical protein
MKLSERAFLMMIRVAPTEIIAMNVALDYYFRWCRPELAVIEALTQYLQRLIEQAEQLKKHGSCGQEVLFPVQVMSHEARAMGVALEKYGRCCTDANPETLELAKRYAERLVREIEREHMYEQRRSATILP